MSIKSVFTLAKDFLNSIQMPDYQNQQFWEIDDKWFEKTCNHPEHFPPSHIMIPKGMNHKHVCPGCGEAKYIRNNNDITY
ncbi:hypothetical protein PBI_SCTP2_515 [Salicola phage SCTP-2]|nr:hypothetical protein PBI_SCTP2_515 [Salicola phage SCTP-2]